MAKVGRPSSYTEALGTEICDRIAAGESLRSICKDDHIPDITTVLRWYIQEDPIEFSQQYVKARQAQCELFADELMYIADDSSNDIIVKENSNGEEYEVTNSEAINRSRLRVDTRKWVMSRLLRHRYGEKVEIEHKGEVTHNHKATEDIPFADIRKNAEKVKRLDS